MNKWEEPKDYNPHNPYHREQDKDFPEYDDTNYQNPYNRE